MGSKWAQNLFFPTTLNDEEMCNIPMARPELHIHVMYKTVQAGTILGMGVFGPLISLLRRRPLGATCLRAGKIGALIGIPAGPAMTEMTLNKTNSTDEMVVDRVYRLRYNRCQVRVDRMCTYGALAGAAFAAFTGGAAINGALTGIFVSTLATGVYNNCGMAPAETIIRPKKEEPVTEKDEKADVESPEKKKSS